MPSDPRFPCAQAVAREAGKLIRRRFEDKSSFKLSFKGHQDYLTEVDGEVERLVVSRLHALFPEDTFIGEEGERKEAASRSSASSTIRCATRCLQAPPAPAPP